LAVAFDYIAETQIAFDSEILSDTIFDNQGGFNESYFSAH
jgi:hypothetical protein